MKEFFQDIVQYNNKDWILFHIDTADQHVVSVNVLTSENFKCCNWSIIKYSEGILCTELLGFWILYTVSYSKQNTQFQKMD